MSNTRPAPSAPANPFAAQTTHALRGDYSQMRPDYTVDQPYEAYTEEEQARWRFLYERQSKLLSRYAAAEYVEGLQKLSVGGAIPQLDAANEMLGKATGWSLVAVPGLIPDAAFFEHLAHRRFPVAWWMRRADELDYLVEPDIFHDFFGHVPLLLNPVFARYMQAYGEGGEKAIRYGCEKLLARLYWYIVEFGLIATPEGLRAFGAGMLSSRDETVYSVDSPAPHRVRFDLARVMQTDYMVDAFQKTYFVVDSFETLFDASYQDFAPYYERLKDAPTIDPATILPTDDIINRGAAY